MGMPPSPTSLGPVPAMARAGRSPSPHPPVRCDRRRVFRPQRRAAGGWPDDGARQLRLRLRRPGRLSGRSHSCLERRGHRHGHRRRRPAHRVPQLLCLQSKRGTTRCQARRRQMRRRLWHGSWPLRETASCPRARSLKSSGRSHRSTRNKRACRRGARRPGRLLRSRPTPLELRA